MKKVKQLEGKTEVRRSVTTPESATIPYYHGTRALAAVCISIDGFRLLPATLRQWVDGALGSGIYVTTALDTALYFAHHYVFQVRMSPGTRILRMDGQYDQSVIHYLGREFGKELFSPSFDRAIPSNKHLTRTELIHLANYFWARGQGLAAWTGPEEQAPMRRCLRKHKYDGVGCVESDLGVVVFNPSRLLVENVVQCNRPARGAATEHSADRLTEIDPLRMATEAAETLCAAREAVVELRETLERGEPGETPAWIRLQQDQAAAYLQEIPRWQSCLRAFCTKHGIPQTGHAIASALEE